MRVSVTTHKPTRNDAATYVIKRYDATGTQQLQRQLEVIFIIFFVSVHVDKIKRTLALCLNQIFCQIDTVKQFKTLHFRTIIVL